MSYYPIFPEEVLIIRMSLFYYYGRKKQIVKRYPIPNYDTIVEPFAGAAAYSFHHNAFVKKVILVEKDEKVASIWRWLIEEATLDDIRRLPDLKPGERSIEFLHIIHAATKMAFAFKRINVTPVPGPGMNSGAESRKPVETG